MRLQEKTAPRPTPHASAAPRTVSPRRSLSLTAFQSSSVYLVFAIAPHPKVVCNDRLKPPGDNVTFPKETQGRKAPKNVTLSPSPCHTLVHVVHDLG